MPKNKGTKRRATRSPVSKKRGKAASSRKTKRPAKAMSSKQRSDPEPPPKARKPRRHTELFGFRSKLDTFLTVQGIHFKAKTLSRESGYSRKVITDLLFGRATPTKKCLKAILKALRRLTREPVEASDVFDFLPPTGGAMSRLTPTIRRVSLAVVEDTPENCDPFALFVRVCGNCMSGVVEDGHLLRIDTRPRTPKANEVLVVELPEGAFLGYWEGGDPPRLLHANSAYPPINLGERGPWKVIGKAVAIVSAPVHPRDHRV